MTGRKHDHYRRLFLPPLRRSAVNAMGADMMRLAEEQLGSWPVHEPIDLLAQTKKLVRTFAIGLLFGDDRAHGFPIAEMIEDGTDHNWSWKIFAFPVKTPGTPFYEMLRKAENLESRIMDWAERKRGRIDGGDLLSILVNSPDENGGPACIENAVAHIPTLLGAAHETGESALIWTLLLLDQHPRIARDLYDELHGAGAGGLPSCQELMQLPLLDSIVNESMRLLPPVPQQFRVAEHDTTLDGYPLAARTKVLLSPFLTSLEPELYADADRFLPGRWASISPSPYRCSVFSAGPRGCPGYAFAIAMLKVAVAAILTRYRIALRPGTRIDYKVRVALTPRAAIPAVLLRQDGMFAASSIRGGIRNLVRFPN
jgi:cytochrome P450